MLSPEWWLKMKIDGVTVTSSNNLKLNKYDEKGNISETIQDLSSYKVIISKEALQMLLKNSMLATIIPKNNMENMFYDRQGQAYISPKQLG